MPGEMDVQDSNIYLVHIKTPGRLFSLFLFVLVFWTSLICPEQKSDPEEYVRSESLVFNHAICILIFPKYKLVHSEPN